jgi:hypothetical protein
MTRKLVTCPETGHLEQLELERTPVGLVIVGCSRLRPEDSPGCARECARRLDCRDRVVVDDRDRVLVVVAGSDGATIAIAETLAVDLRRDGLVVELARLDAGATPPLADYDAVVMAVPAHAGRVTRSARAYIRERREALGAMPTFLVAVGGSAADADAYAMRMVERTGWRPVARAAFANPAPGPAILDFARRIADEIPAPAVQPSLR